MPHSEIWKAISGLQLASVLRRAPPDEDAAPPALVVRRAVRRLAPTEAEHLSQWTWAALGDAAEDATPSGAGSRAEGSRASTEVAPSGEEPDGMGPWDGSGVPPPAAEAAAAPRMGCARSETTTWTGTTRRTGTACMPR